MGMPWQSQAPGNLGRGRQEFRVGVGTHRAPTGSLKHSSFVLDVMAPETVLWDRDLSGACDLYLLLSFPPD